MADRKTATVQFAHELPSRTVSGVQLIGPPSTATSHTTISNGGGTGTGRVDGKLMATRKFYNSPLINYSTIQQRTGFGGITGNGNDNNGSATVGIESSPTSTSNPTIMSAASTRVPLVRTPRAMTILQSETEKSMLAAKHEINQAKKNSTTGGKVVTKTSNNRKGSPPFATPATPPRVSSAVSVNRTKVITQPVVAAELSSSKVSLPRNDSEEKINFQILQNLQQRLGYMWQARFHTDVIFIVGNTEEKVEAHRLILSSCSPIFEQLLYESTPLIMDDKYILYESDFDATSFNLFLMVSKSSLQSPYLCLCLFNLHFNPPALLYLVYTQFVYTNEIPQCLPFKIAVDSFHLSKKYEIVHLQQMLLLHITQILNIENVFDVLAISTKIFELTHMISKCWNLIETQTEVVLKTHFDTMSLPMLIRILDRETLNIQEIDLFLYVESWSTGECKRRKLKITGKNKREVIEPLIKRIRFPTMPIGLFQDLVVPTGILNTYECGCVVEYIKHPNEATSKYLPYKLHKRQMVPIGGGGGSNMENNGTIGVNVGNMSGASGIGGGGRSRPTSSQGYYYAGGSSNSGGGGGTGTSNEESHVKLKPKKKSGQGPSNGSSSTANTSTSVPSSARVTVEHGKRAKTAKRQKTKSKVPQTHR